MKKYNEEMARRIQDFLKKDDWNYSFDESKGVFSFGIRLKGRIKSIRYLIRLNKDDYSVYGYSPVTPDPDDKTMMQAMTEFICRANYGLISGRFEMDMEDGELRYHTFVNCEDMNLSEAVIKRSIYTVAHMFDQYAQGIVDVVFGGKEAKEACDACEEESDRRAKAAARLLELMSSGADSAKITSLLSRLTGEAEGSEGDDEPEGEADDLPMDVFDDQDDE